MPDNVMKNIRAGIAVLPDRVAALRPGRRTRGFTLIELLVVMAILALLVLLAQPRIAHWIVSSKESALREDLLVMRKAIDQHYADKGKYPEALADLVAAKYIRAVPRDPFTESADTWSTVPAEGEETGTIDVKSGAQGTGSDGVPYKDW